MKLTKINLTNFRNYDKLELNFDKNINIFIGNNAQGKTNILESIYVLSITKSHRTSKDLLLIKENELFTKIQGLIQDDDKETTYEVLINEKGKKVSINDNSLKKISYYLSNINAIMFCPDDLEIIKGSPIKRRSFFNLEISGFNNNYVKNLSEYNKLLKTRNEYLKNNNIINNDYFEILTDKLIDLNIKIYLERKKFIDDLNKYIKDIYLKISGNNNIFIKYESFIEYNDDLKEIKYQLQNKFDRVYNNEILNKITLLGIHRDDFSIYIDDNKINDYGSQGQHRVAILCLRLAEIELYRREYNKKPIILLDDIFSELDKNKKNNIINYIDNDLQVFITSTDLDNIDKKIIKNADIFTIDNGKVTRGE